MKRCGPSVWSRWGKIAPAGEHHESSSDRGRYGGSNHRAPYFAAQTEESPEQVGAKLCDLLGQNFSPAQRPELLFAHRWRYAFTKTPLGKGFLWSQGLQIGICGDWCIGRSVEDAWTSAMALAGKISKIS